MAEENRVVLYGMWFSPFVKRVESAQIRFWADFIQNQLFEGILIRSVKTEGEEQEKVTKEVKEKLKVFEEQGLKTLLSESNNNNTPFVNGHELGFLDIVGLTVLGMYEIYEQFLGIKIVEEQNVPILLSWVNSLIQHPIVKESAAPKEKLLELLHFVRQNALINKS